MPLLTSKQIACFITTNTICHYGVLRELISDHETYFKDETT